MSVQLAAGWGRTQATVRFPATGGGEIAGVFGIRVTETDVP